MLVIVSGSKNSQNYQNLIYSLICIFAFFAADSSLGSLRMKFLWKFKVHFTVRLTCYLDVTSGLSFLKIKKNPTYALEKITLIYISVIEYGKK